ncbi:pseudomurein-binding repeat-containing protein [uncultured Methanobacterium sp.]|uniref:pseudomurein-binding repeat-containing protein n=1 Tax=uncultured Methanobacterium sp. TaxID=176306 RepID=UPI002AA7CB60|nr:pseudomurein-binding repeat-containing protein [uncultured Methanobacterium sp.]
MLLLLVVVALVPGINYATPNQSVSDNFTNTTNISEIVENNTNSSTIQNTTTAVVNDTGTTQQENQTTTTSNNTHNSSSENTNQTDTIQNYTAAASDGTYNNVHALWLNVDDVNNVNVNELITAGITDVFVKANRITSPTYQTVLTTIINKLQGTGIRIHAWITCFVDANGNWVDPKDSTVTDALVKTIADITTNYDISGIHLDYVRYPGTAYEHSGGTEAITSFVQRVYTTVKSIKTKVAVSAALMPEGAVNAYYYGQDYAQLSKYLDFLVPMIYEGNYKEDNEWITTTTAYIVSHSTKPVVAGLQTYQSDDNVVALSAEEINQDIKSALAGGASGFALFRYGWVDKDFFKSTSTTTFTREQIAAAAVNVKAYIESNKCLPSTVSVAGVSVNIAQYLYLACQASVQIGSGSTGGIALPTVSVPAGFSEEMTSGNVTKPDYLDLASRIVSYMNSNHQAPIYGLNGLGKISYQSLTYLYTRILASYSTNNALPTTMTVLSWKTANIPINDTPNTSTTTFTREQIAAAAVNVKAYIESNKCLPSTVSVAGVSVNIAQYLYLACQASVQIGSGSTGGIALPTVSVPAGFSEEMTSGNVNQADYLDLASRIVSYMNSNHQAPIYGLNGLGKISYQSLVYMYTRVLAYSDTYDALPNYVVMKTWSAANIPMGSSSPSSTTFTPSEIADAAVNVKAYIESNKCLPSTVSVAGVSVNIAQYLYLAAQASIQINSGSTSEITLPTLTVPAGFSEEMTSGKVNQADYLDLASRIVSYMDSNGQAPIYGLNGLGKISYQSLVYMYTRVLAYSDTNDALPNYVVVKPWSSANIPINGTSTTGTSFSISEIADAALRVKNYIENNKAMPNYVQMGSVQVNMAQFLHLLTTATVNLNNKNTASIDLNSETLPSSSYEQMSSGNLYLADYVDFAQRIASYMDANNKAPESGLVGLGTICYQSQIYLYSRVLSYYGANGELPNYAAMKPWSSIVGINDPVPADLLQYLQETTNCQVNDPSIIALAQSITSGATSSYDKAQRIFNWVRDNIDYSYYYDSQKGALGTLSSGSANCCDHSHLIVALSRAAGLPARYVHGTCYFISSGNWYGHVWAQIYVNGQWYNADATSSRNSLGVINNWDTNSWTYQGTYASLPF